MKKVKEFIDKLTDYIDLGIFYLGYILVFIGVYLGGFWLIRFLSTAFNPYRDTATFYLALSIVGVYFIRSYKKKDK